MSPSVILSYSNLPHFEPDNSPENAQQSLESPKSILPSTSLFSDTEVDRYSDDSEMHDAHEALSHQVLSTESSAKPPTPTDRQWFAELQLPSEAEQAIRVLQYPEWMHQHITSSPEAYYAIWCDGGDEHDTDYDPVAAEAETELLVSILDHFPPSRVDLESYTGSDLSSRLRAVFIHVRGLKRLSAIPNLMELRRQPYTVFVTYGTDHDHGVDPSQWAFKEIFPMGKRWCSAGL